MLPSFSFPAIKRPCTMLAGGLSQIVVVGKQRPCPATARPRRERQHCECRRRAAAAATAQAGPASWPGQPRRRAQQYELCVAQEIPCWRHPH
jgi:hypothetical protein